MTPEQQAVIEKAEKWIETGLKCFPNRILDEDVIIKDLLTLAKELDEANHCIFPKSNCGKAKKWT